MTLLKTIKKLGRVRTELAILAILVPLVIILGALLVRWPQAKDSNTKSPTTNEPVEKIPNTTPSVSTTPQNTPPAVSVKQAFAEVTLIIEKEEHQQKWQIAIEQEATVEEVLNLAAAKKYLEVKSTDYGGSMGIFIESLGGIANNNIEKVYWHLYINDVLSPVGASQAEVKAGDTVTWKYEKQHDEN